MDKFRALAVKVGSVVGHEDEPVYKLMHVLSAAAEVGQAILQVRAGGNAAVQARRALGKAALYLAEYSYVTGLYNKLSYKPRPDQGAPWEIWAPYELLDGVSNFRESSVGFPRGVQKALDAFTRIAAGIEADLVELAEQAFEACREQ